MSREPAEKDRTSGRSGPLIFLAAAVLLLLAALYVLSIGPVVWLVEGGYIDGNSSFLKVFYTPLALAAKFFPPLEWALEVYMELFR